MLGGHAPHCTAEFFQCCVRHNVHLISLPSHSTHPLQPLHVGPFRPKVHSTEQDERRGRGNNAVRGGNFHERVLVLEHWQIRDS